MWVQVGSIYESDAEAGISHVYEHMLFKGTTTRGVGEIAQEIEGSGGDINAFTSFDHTVYHITLASRYLDTGLAVIADAIQHSAFDADELRKEQEVVLEEIKRGADIPSRKLTEAVFATSYQCHPYRRPVIGSEQVVKSFSRAQILSFFSTWYVPNNMTLVVTGDFDSTVLLPRIQAAFEDFRAQTLPRLEVLQEPAQGELRSVVLTDDIQEALLDAAYHVPGVRHKDSAAIDLLAFILGGGESSLLVFAEGSGLAGARCDVAGRPVAERTTRHVGRSWACATRGSEHGRAGSCEAKPGKRIHLPARDGSGTSVAVGVFRRHP
jgi:zinc protease